MAAMTLLIDRRGAQASLHGSGVVELRYPDGETHRIGLRGLRRIIVQGEAQLSSGLLRACHAEGIAVMLAPARGRGDATHLFPPARESVGLRHEQYACHADPPRRLALASALVSAKIEQQALWLEAHGFGVGAMRQLAGEATSARDLDALMGLEGAAAARYFGLWARAWQDPWHFPGRNRRPPRDPVNALLSLGYTLALNPVGQQAALRGLDVSLGFLHAPHSGRPSLALDLLEPVRPWVDQWVWRFLSNGTLQPGDFTYSAEEGCRLGKKGRAEFYRRWHATEGLWLPRPTRHAMAIVLTHLRKTTGQPSPAGRT